MKIVCFPHFYYLSEASRLVEIGKALRGMGQDIVFFTHGGSYESVAKDEGFEVIPVQPTMSPDRAEDYKAFNRAERGNPFRDSFFSYEELKAYVRQEADAFRQVGADAVLIGWNLPSYLSVQLVSIPIIVQQPGPFTAPFYDKKMGVFVPSLVGWLRHLPMDWFVNWLIPRTKLWLAPFNRLAADLGLPQYKSLLDMMAGDLTLVMEHRKSWVLPAKNSSTTGRVMRRFSTGPRATATAGHVTPSCRAQCRIRWPSTSTHLAPGSIAAWVCPVHLACCGMSSISSVIWIFRH
jgi:hypothetical protein